MNYFFYSLFIVCFFFQSCKKAQNEQKNSSYQPGVVISFDDAFIDEWYNVNDTLIPYDWRATFFVTEFQKLSSDKLKKINQLKDLGHEIGGHGYNHLDAQKFCLSNGINNYLNQEISPMILSMGNNGVVPTSFAYPYGSRNHQIDSLLFTHFKILRGTTYGNLLPADQKCYFDNNRLVFGIGIDSHYSHFSISYVIKLLKYALEQNKIVIFYAHKPVLSYTKKYETEYNTLLEICKFVKINKMKFYTMSELAHYLK